MADTVKHAKTNWEDHKDHINTAAMNYVGAVVNYKAEIVDEVPAGAEVHSLVYMANGNDEYYTVGTTNIKLDQNQMLKENSMTDSDDNKARTDWHDTEWVYAKDLNKLGEIINNKIEVVDSLPAGVSLKQAKYLRVGDLYYIIEGGQPVNPEITLSLSKSSVKYGESILNLKLTHKESPAEYFKDNIVKLFINNVYQEDIQVSNDGATIDLPAILSMTEDSIEYKLVGINTITGETISKSVKLIAYAPAYYGIILHGTDPTFDNINLETGINTFTINSIQAGYDVYFASDRQYTSYSTNLNPYPAPFEPDDITQLQKQFGSKVITYYFYKCIDNSAASDEQETFNLK